MGEGWLIFRQHDGENAPPGQCRKGNCQCGDYTRDHHFKNLSALDHDILLVRSQPLVLFTEPSFLICVDDSSSHEVKKVPNGGDDGEAEEKKRRAADLPQIFLDGHVPKENIDTNNGPIFLLQNISNLQGTNVPLDLAVAALSMARPGREHGDEMLRRKAWLTMAKLLSSSIIFCQMRAQYTKNKHLQLA